MARAAIAITFLLSGAFAVGARANDWKRLTHQPTGKNASTLFLLMDGRVLMNDNLSEKWWILTPSSGGSYVAGTWSAAADSLDDRLYYASGVLADGRVIIAGGEYSNTGGTDKAEIYDPVTDTWTSIPTPTGWGYIGDAPSVVLPDGRFFMGHITDNRTAIYDPKTNAWTDTANKLNTSSLEETWTPLPDGTVVSCDCPGHPGSELYDPVLDVWISLGNTPVDLVDNALEIGPSMMMMNGEVVFFGATPHSCHYTPSTTAGGIGTWVQGGDPPLVGGKAVSAYDAPGAMVPSGNILVALGDHFSAPTYFFEYDGVNFIRAPDPGNNNVPAYYNRLLVLPNGKILQAADTVYLYTADGSPDPAWKPTIASVATDLIPGETYLLEGTLLNGLSTANSYGDECGVATNYPIVRLTFDAGGVVYCRAFDPSTMGYATGSTIHSTHFIVPPGQTGAAVLEVSANGFASDPVPVMVRDPITIDFDALATGIPVTNQFAEATFSSTTGFENLTVAAGTGASVPNMICTAPVGGAPDCTHATFVDFPCPVASLTFRAIGVDGSGPLASVAVFSNGVLAGSVAVEGAGTPSVPVRVDLTRFHDVTRIEIDGITDAGGIAWDDFVFCLASTAECGNYGTGFPGTLGVPSFTCLTPPVIGTTMTAQLDNSAGVTTVGLVLVSDQSAFIPTSKGGDLLVLPLLSIAVSLAPGVTPLDADIANDPGTCGVEIFAQALELDGGAAKGLSFTAGLRLVLGY